MDVAVGDESTNTGDAFSFNLMWRLQYFNCELNQSVLIAAFADLYP